MSVITNITDYEARLLALLPEQFRTGTNWGKLFTAIAQSGGALQDAEDTLYAIWQQRTSLALAVGAQLDQWGDLVGLPREGWGDDSYRARILVWLRVLRSTGTPDELIRIAADMSGATLPGTGVRLWEHPPASYSVQVLGDIYQSDPELALDTARYLALADPAGVGIGQVISGGSSLFTFGSDGSKGFSEEGGTSYGLLGTDTATEGGV